MSHADAILEHLVSLAMTPGWKEYSWWAAKNYAQINPAELADMPQRLKERMLQQKEKQQ